MRKADRIYKLENLLKNRKFVSRTELLSILEISRATLTRDIEFLRSQLNAPLIYDPELMGYRLEKNNELGEVHELPGMWFNETEIHALLSIESLLESIQPGLVAPHIAPLKQRLNAILGEGKHVPDEIRRRVLLRSATPRHLRVEHFQMCATATLSRKRLLLTHHDRHFDTINQREISPQRVVRYKENWYLDTWCHQREAIRTFSIDALRGAKLLDKAAIEVSEAELDAVLASGYGIYAGKDVGWATLRFTPWQGPWTANEIWHPDQRSHYDEDGRFILEVPYSATTELIMDILKYGPEVEVLAPESLRNEISERLYRAFERYKEKRK